MNPIQSIFYKEWHKSRYPLLLCFLIFMVMMGKEMMILSAAIRSAGSDQIWQIIILKGVIPYASLSYIPPIIGVILAAAQFIPERIQKRLKLSLHLPMSESKTLCYMLSYGLMAMALMTIIIYGSFLIYSTSIFPQEVIYYWIPSALLGVLSGIVAYLLAAWIMIEPTPVRNFINILIALALLSLFFVNDSGAAYRYAFPLLIVIVVVSFILNYDSLRHFKGGGESADQ